MVAIKRKNNNKLMADLNQQLLRPIDDLLRQIPTGTAIGLGLSAGADSAMLAVHSAAIASKLGLRLHCIHIHHGLQQPADAWLEQAHKLAANLKLPCHSKRLQFAVKKTGLEAAARQARYAAMKAIADKLGIAYVLLAHHQNDQAETVLFRLLRGAGPLGLGAMSSCTEKNGIFYIRPWLNQPREIIMQSAKAYAQQTGWQFVKDPSNTDTRYARGVLRTEVAPILDKHWPSWRSTLTRHAQQAQELSSLVDASLAKTWLELEPDSNNQSFSLALWRAQASWMQAQLIRYWLDLNKLNMPSQARMNEWLKQLRSVHQMGTDRNLSLKHDKHLIQLKHGRVCLN